MTMFAHRPEVEKEFLHDYPVLQSLYYCSPVIALAVILSLTL